MSGTPDVIKPHKPLIRARYKKAPNINGRNFWEKTAVKVEEPVPKLEEPVPKVEEQVPKVEESVSNIEIPEGEPISTETINITGRKFEIRYDKENRSRRAEVFSGSPTNKKLTENEEDLLKAIGITNETRGELLPYLADFFNSLPSCQSSSQMLTNRRCEIAYYIMWSVLLKARQATQQKIDNQHKAGITDLDTHQVAASVDAMATVKTTLSGQDHSEHMQIIDIVTRIENNLKNVKKAVNTLPKSGGGLSEMNRLFRKRSRI